MVLASGGAAGDFSKMDGAERPFSANLQNHQEIRSLYSEIKERYGKLDILVICTDVYRGGSVTKATAEDWEISYQTNVYTLFQLVNNAIPYMYESGGVIVNVTGGRYVAALPGHGPLRFHDVCRSAHDEKFCGRGEQIQNTFQHRLCGEYQR